MTAADAGHPIRHIGPSPYAPLVPGSMARK